MKICSLLASGTEILFALGLGDDVIGVTEYCNYPPAARTKTVVSRGLIDIHRLTMREVDEEVRELARAGKPMYFFDTKWLAKAKPDLILTQDMCRACDVEASEVYRAIFEFEPKPEVLVLNPRTLSDIFHNIQRVGDAAGVDQRAQRLVAELQARIEIVSRAVSHALNRPRVLFMEWLDPPAAAGDWIPDQIRLAGGYDQLSQPGAAPPHLDWQEVLTYDPEIIIIGPCSSAPQRSLREIPRLASRDGWGDLQAVRKGQVYIVNSGYYDRPGPRVVEGIEMLAELFHPQLVVGKIRPGEVVKLRAPDAQGCAPEQISQYFEPFPCHAPVP